MNFLNAGINLIFPTPVGVYDFHNVEDMNEEILDFFSKPNKKTNNVWDFQFDALNKLKSMFEEKAKNIMHFNPTKFNNVDIEVSRGWIQTLNKNEFHSAHTHSGSLIVAVYYLQCPEESVDLLLHDPSAGSFWTNYYEDGQDSRVYNRVNTKKGRMIVFPGHIVHSTDLNRTDKSRTAIATNFKVSYD